MSSPTEGYAFHHTMIRVKDPVKSVDFYTRLLGMKQVAKFDYPSGKFSLYFMAFYDKEIPTDLDEAAKFDFIFAQNVPFIELTHNWGTESDPDFSYHNGNTEPRGYGHIAIVVPDVYAATERLEKEGVTIIKAPDAGSMKGLAFVADPDGYRIEILRKRV